MKSKLSTRPSPSAELRRARSHVVDVATTSTQFCTRVPPEVLDARRGVKQVFYDSFQAKIDLGSCLAASVVANLISPPRSHMHWAIPDPALYFVCSVCGCPVTVSDIRTVFCTPVLTTVCARAAPHVQMRSFTCLSMSWCRPFWSTRMCRCKIPCIAFILWAQTNLHCFLHLEKSTKRKWRARRRDIDLLLNKEVVAMWSQRHVWFTRHRWQDCNHSASCYSDDSVRLTVVSNSELAIPV